MKLKQRDKDSSLDKANAENKASLKGIDRRKVSLKAVEGLDATGEVGASMVPTEEQLAKINQFTRIDATADNVVTFHTMSCNDIYDRDDEKFTKRCIDDFAALEPPFSAVGKSFMSDHNYEMGSVRGRIFDVGTQTVKGNHFLTNDVYVPNTEQYKSYIENIDFGLAWAVSVGVVVDAANCSICNAPVYQSRFFGSWCENGHDKGYYYDPKSDEKDSWGYYMPCDPSTPGAVKAYVHLSEPRDIYEVSQVFLGAQYMAELAKEPGFRGMLKVASANIPIIGLSSEDAKHIKMWHEPAEVTAARSKYHPELAKDGLLRWTDDQGLVWAYDSADGQVGCLGKTMEPPSVSETDPPAPAEWDKGRIAGLIGRQEALRASQGKIVAKMAQRAAEDDSGGSDDEDDDPVELAQALDAVLDEIEDALDNEQYQQADDLLTSAKGTADQLIEALGGTDADDVDPEGDKAVTKDEMLKIIRGAKLPDDIKQAALPANTALQAAQIVVAQASKTIAAQSSEIEGLKPKAALGDAYVAEAEADAIHWYTVGRKDYKNPNVPVNVELAQKLIARCGGDVALIKELAEDWKKDAKAKFPTARRASAMGDGEDPNAPNEPEKLPAGLTGLEVDPKASKLHS